MLKKLGMCALAITICTMIYLGATYQGAPVSVSRTRILKGADEAKIRPTKALRVTKANGLIGGREDYEMHTMTNGATTSGLTEQEHTFLMNIKTRLNNMNKFQLVCNEGTQAPEGKVIATIINPDLTEIKGGISTGAIMGKSLSHCKFYFKPGELSESETLNSIETLINNEIGRAPTLKIVHGGTKEAATGKWLVQIKRPGFGGDLYVIKTNGALSLGQPSIALEEESYTITRPAQSLSRVTTSTPIQPVSQRIPVINRMR